ncbi:WD domain, G-beta repeat containing protein [Entamoeba histolytica HM-1:IMSS-B]|uniref:WD domain containing protein n=6 Tax=Entamoeba histolytica TaxID=5759 RepID=C4M0Z1_ENTH1|nr:WD domain containing protein [Entamoeba histolytica HM-1:IMSS]EMD48602.1 WD domain containing protein [Entamoeba histolytica KU27]EMH76441.1 WD domain, G-beta repeat containing protein [Entamoeba histolytica HM-1:IMSS-B]EMS14494.1 WD domain, G-beta repeat-containing protein, putative [Entamoeba histolytica HM-3:IMSS]ENY61277.1 WD domain, G-beta repeat-containing protein [Entamoeba histolytica HM-1:IMSS-A]GAT94848.1 WD domain containing protein [Entamoeba histolytica]|eukprot:XP_651662.1 WD domain containing protein [Entamoeba histolytica HM-1:IMSS]
MKSDFHHLDKLIQIYPINKFQYSLQRFCENEQISNELYKYKSTKLKLSINPLIGDDFIGRDIGDWVGLSLKSKRTKKHITTNSLYKEIYVEGVVNQFYFNCIDWIENSLIVGLSNSVFAVNVITNENCQLIPTYELYSVSCVKKEGKKTVILGDCDGTLYQIDLEENVVSNKAKIHNDRIGRIICRENIIVTGSKDKKLNLIDRRISFDKPTSSTLFEGEICGLVIKDNTICIGTSNHIVYVYDIRFNNTPINIDYFHKSAVKALCFEINRNNVILSGGGIRDRTIERWNYLTNERSYVETNAQVVSIDYKEKQEYILVALGYPSNGFIQLDYQMNVLNRFDGHEGRLLSTAGFSSHEDPLYASLGSDCKINIWDFM